MSRAPNDDGRHPGASVEEWLFAAWSPDGRTGIVSGHRLLGRIAWYWAALAAVGRPLLHLAEWEVVVRSDPFVVKAPEMWAEHHCVAPLEQWSVGNEAFAAALDEPDEALGRGYGTPTPMAFDLEWYGTGPPSDVPHGYEQSGVVHGLIEILGQPPVEMVEAPAHRWHRWSDGDGLAPVELEVAAAHAGARAPFAFPDGSVADWVLTPRGWRSRIRPR
jgi:hypothetical protein